MASFLDLPVELIVIILSYLDVRDLNAIADTCHSLNHVINNQELWKSMFKTRFAVDQFSSVSRSRKFSAEMFERTDVTREWRKGQATHTITPLKTVRSLLSVQLHYPVAMTLHDEGLIAVTDFGKGKAYYDVPVTVGQRATSSSFDSKAAVYGNSIGGLFVKYLGKKDVWSSKQTLPSPHKEMITSLYNHWPYCYSGDIRGKIVVTDIKFLSVVHEYQLPVPLPIVGIKGRKSVVVVACDLALYVLNGEGVRGEINTIHHSLERVEYFEVDFGGKVIIISDGNGVHAFSFDAESFGKTSSYLIPPENRDFDGEPEWITALSMEHKEELTHDRKIAGQDGRNLAIIISHTRIVTFNLRRGDLKVQSEFKPFLPAQVSPVLAVRCIDVNSSILAVGFFDGCAAVYDVLNGQYLRTVANKVHRRFLRWNNTPCRFITLGKNNKRYGIVEVNCVLQFFEVGEDVHGHASSKTKKALPGVNIERKKKFDKSIKHAVNDMEHYDYEDQVKEELLEKYNGGDLIDGEDLEMAIALSMQDQEHEERSMDIAATESALLEALELSRLQFESEMASRSTDDLTTTGHPPGTGDQSIQDGNEAGDGNGLDDDEEFKRQLEEAMKRSMYE